MERFRIHIFFPPSEARIRRNVGRPSRMGEASTITSEREDSDGNQKNSDQFR